MPEKYSIIGQTFGRLKVLSEGPDYIYGKGKINRRSICQCSCGNICTVKDNAMKNGNTKSCGCWCREVRARTPFKHGMSHQRIHSVWAGMLDRCRNKAHKSYKHYGGRGVKVCERWQTFTNFFEDVGEGKKGWSLERINNNAGYELSNICWATRVHQARNTSFNTVFTICGVTGCIAALCEHFKIPPNAVYGRLARGWPANEAFLVPYKFRLRISLRHSSPRAHSKPSSI